jgi:hypothetical protein
MPVMSRGCKTFSVSPGRCNETIGGFENKPKI